MSKIVTVAALAAGYVLGSRAGRDDYRQLKAQAQKLWQDPRVQDKASQAAAVAKNAAVQAKDQIPGLGTQSGGGKHSSVPDWSDSPQVSSPGGPDSSEAR